MAVRFSQLLIRQLSNTSNKDFTTILRTRMSRQVCFKNYAAWSATKGGELGDDEQQKKKTKIIPKITLIQGSLVTITTLEEAQKLSKRRDLKLVKIVDVDTKTQRPTYQLMSGSEYHAEDIKQREERKKSKKNDMKGEKMIMLNYNIALHDLDTYINKMIKWIQKSYEVRVVINGDVGKMNKAVSN